ncbi:MAG: histidine kinase [Acidobacteria bacterium]|nr:histidine kinase [Acidobacteriota bacterium]
MTPVVPDGHFVNWFGHSAGAVVFGLFFGLLWGDRSPGRNKALVATLIAFLWNAAELAGLAQGSVGPYLAAFESSLFSFLPALLFDLVISGDPPLAVRTGYALSGCATVLHLAELISDSDFLHGAGLDIVATGFCALAMYAAIRRRQRALPALALLLLSLSILHFAEDERHAAWWVEVLVHHGGIPLAMFVLLQDYRFVFLDALIRFLANILVALVFSAAALVWREKWPSTALAAITGLLILYAFTRVRVQTLLTRLAFRRTDPPAFRANSDEPTFLDQAEQTLRIYFGAGPAVLEADPAMDGPQLLANGREAALGIRLTSGQIRMMRFGRRPGGRRYMSEDGVALRRAAARIREGIEAIRDAGILRLVSQAELRALQAQIHPHFLFNAFNTLYGVIPKEAAGARRTVLNLADIFRYFLRTNQTFVSLEEELRIVRAYLEIEGLRLGAKLKTELNIHPDAAQANIPLLSIEPLIENAVKHGVAPKAAGGSVQLSVRPTENGILVEVADTGVGFPASDKPSGGVGLENVRQRLRLCYGPDADLDIQSSSAGTTVRFTVPRSA